MDYNYFYEFVSTITISWLFVYKNVFIMCKMSVDFRHEHTPFSCSICNLFAISRKVFASTTSVTIHGKCLGNSGLQFLQVRNWGSKNLGLDKTQKEEVQWGYVWWAWGPRRRSVPSYPLVRQGFIRFWEGSLSYLLEVWFRTILIIMALKCIKIM